MVKERPILMNGQMVRATLDDLKTNTRRVMKPQPEDYDGVAYSVDGTWYGWREHTAMPFDDIRWNCPYGKPGDRLWVRETHQFEDTYSYAGEERTPTDGRPIKTFHDDPTSKIIPRYRATEPDTYLCITEDEWGDPKMAWRPSIFMPRWASRILLEVTEVRVERVQDITEDDCIAEGISRMVECTEEDPLDEHNTNMIATRSSAVCTIETFGELWDSINAKRGFGWDVNPWVWVVVFKRIK